MPLGVVAVVYEARPNVTIDAAALCLKSGNAIVLRGSSSATHSNAALAQIAADAAVEAGLPAAASASSPAAAARSSPSWPPSSDSVDLIIPRGGESLKHALQAVATVPVIYAASGNCHVYVDATPTSSRRWRSSVNAKTQRPGVCNAAETLLVHEALPASSSARRRALGAAACTVRGRRAARAPLAAPRERRRAGIDDADRRTGRPSTSL